MTYHFFANNLRRISQVIDRTFWESISSDSFVNQLMPIVNYPDPTLLIAGIKGGKPTIASIVAPEQEVPNQRNEVELTLREFRKVKLGKQRIATETDFEVEEKMMTLLADNPSLQQYRDYFYDQARSYIQAINEKAALLAAQTLVTGSGSFTDPLTGLRWSVNYPDTIAELLPADLAGGELWSAAATANGLQNLRTHAEAYYLQFGVYPEVLCLKRKNLWELRNQESTIRAWYQRTGNPTDAGTDFTNVFLEDDILFDLIRARTQVQRIELVDYRVREEQSDGSIVETHLFPEDYYFFAEMGNVQRAVVPCWEKVRHGRAGANEISVQIAPRSTPYYVATRVLSDLPRQERTGAAGSVIPAVIDDRKIAARKVSA